MALLGGGPPSSGGLENRGALADEGRAPGGGPSPPGLLCVTLRGRQLRDRGGACAAGEAVPPPPTPSSAVGPGPSPLHLAGLDDRKRSEVTAKGLKVPRFHLPVLGTTGSPRQPGKQNDR